MSALPSMKTSPTLAVKEQRLIEQIQGMNQVIVALSGGVDSAVVAKAAYLALGDSALAVTADSPSVARVEVAAAIELAQHIGISHRIVKTTEFDNPDYQRNGGDRCFFCKDELYTRIGSILQEYDQAVVCSGANLDDLGDYRPGLTAAANHAVRHPLQEAGFSKADVRLLAKHWQLPVWDKPASPCLSSRLAPGLAVTAERTWRVEQAEAYLKSLGLRECRVRYHEGDLARIEVPLAELSQIAEPQTRSALTEKFHEFGFQFVTLDLDGFRSGSLNDLVPLTLKKKYQRFAVELPNPS